IMYAAAWAVTLGLFASARNYGVAVGLLTLAGVFNIAFSAMAQTLVQMLAPPGARGRIVGLFNTAVLGLRAGSGVTVGMLGAVIGIHLSLAIGTAAVLASAAGLLAREARSVRTNPPR
ncbi:MAG TPA: MFS transporter, partial [Methylomirabilota bacterium]|nr:MFS transporter [Methylomirabilota bacterium]